MPCVLAKINSLSINISNHLFGILCQACGVYWNSVFALFCVLELHHARLACNNLILVYMQWKLEV